MESKDEEHRGGYLGLDQLLNVRDPATILAECAPFYGVAKGKWESIANLLLLREKHRRLNTEVAITWVEGYV